MKNSLSDEKCPTFVDSLRYYSGMGNWILIKERLNSTLSFFGPVDVLGAGFMPREIEESSWAPIGRSLTFLGPYMMPCCELILSRRALLSKSEMCWLYGQPHVSCCWPTNCANRPGNDNVTSSNCWPDAHGRNDSAPVFEPIKDEYNNCSCKLL